MQMSYNTREPEGHLRPPAPQGKQCDWVATRRDTRHVKASAFPSTGHYYTPLLSQARVTLLHAAGWCADVLVMAAMGGSEIGSCGALRGPAREPWGLLMSKLAICDQSSFFYCFVHKNPRTKEVTMLLT
jgi:hypothetical protein